MLPSTSAPGLRRLVIGCWLRLRLRNRWPPATLRALIASAPPPPAIATPPCRQLLSVRSEHAVSHSVPPEPPLPGSEPGHGYQVTSCPKGKRPFRPHEASQYEQPQPQCTKQCYQHRQGGAAKPTSRSKPEFASQKPGALHSAQQPDKNEKPAKPLFRTKATPLPSTLDTRHRRMVLKGPVAVRCGVPLAGSWRRPAASVSLMSRAPAWDADKLRLLVMQQPARKRPT
ncbi:hypothetical protein CCHR01_15598 [Colletotrichum chrysophilum]|uniref:Uncharacterized protein n=1 Tax=Colletotrichum chrysophilum TaxID=1836956 RepID=A0AAD9A641_9PEZI|nr:hypothetical protein CCHR01_15598 [Colletotrichum chrysophilum]